jgi:hypothetical protein
MRPVIVDGAEHEEHDGRLVPVGEVDSNLNGHTTVRIPEIVARKVGAWSDRVRSEW